MRNLIVAASLLLATGANAQPLITAGQIIAGYSGPTYQVEPVRYRGWHRWGAHRYWYPRRAWGHRWRPYGHYYWNDGPYYSPYWGWRRPYWGWGPYWGRRHYYQPGVTLEFGWP